jgi:dephospho-CoA kinase
MLAAMGHVLGLLGGVASGKSTVATLLARRGYLHLDADALARQAVERPEIRSALAARFGSDLHDGEGGLDRALLADRAFRDPAATADLNAIVHPWVRDRLVEGLDGAGPRPVVLDVPLLMESPLAERVDTWVLVEAPEAARDARAASRGWSPGERARREARQADLVAKRRRADRVLENSGTIEDLERRLEVLLVESGLPTTSP